MDLVGVCYHCCSGSQGVVLFLNPKIKEYYKNYVRDLILLFHLSRKDTKSFLHFLKFNVTTKEVGYRPKESEKLV